MPLRLPRRGSVKRRDVRESLEVAKAYGRVAAMAAALLSEMPSTSTKDLPHLERDLATAISVIFNASSAIMSRRPPRTPVEIGLYQAVQSLTTMLRDINADRDHDTHRRKRASNPTPEPDSAADEAARRILGMMKWDNLGG